MRTKNTYDLALALYKIGCSPHRSHVEKYVYLCDENGFKWYQFENNELEKKIGVLIYKKENNIPIPVANVYKVEHLVGILKQMCIDAKKHSVYEEYEL